MDEEFLLFDPGPVPVSDDVGGAMDEPLVSRRSADLEALGEHAWDGLDHVNG